MNKINTLVKTAIATVINYGKKQVKRLLEGKCNNNKNVKRNNRGINYYK